MKDLLTKWSRLEPGKVNHHGDTAYLGEHFGFVDGSGGDYRSRGIIQSAVQEAFIEDDIEAEIIFVPGAVAVKVAGKYLVPAGGDAASALVEARIKWLEEEAETDR